MTCPTDREVIDYLVDESSASYVKRGVSMANRKFVISLSADADIVRLDFAVRSGSGRGAYDGAVVVGASGALVGSCQCPASAGFMVCKHVIAAILVDWRERREASFIASAMASDADTSRDESAAMPVVVESRRTEEQWRSDVAAAGWGRILDMTARQVTGNGVRVTFGYHPSATYFLDHCGERLMAFVLASRITGIPDAVKLHVHDWFVRQVREPKVRAPLCDAESADDLASPEVQELVYALQEKVVQRPLPMAEELYQQTRVGFAEEEAELQVSNLPVGIFEESTSRATVIVRPSRTDALEFTVMGLDGKATAETAVSLACNTLLHRMREETAFGLRCAETLNRDPSEKFLRGWRELARAPRHELDGKAAKLEPAEECVIGYRIGRPENAYYRAIDVVVRKRSVTRTGKEGKLRWVLADGAWVRALLDSGDSPLSLEDRAILERFRVRNNNQYAGKKFSLTSVAGEQLSWLQAHPHVMVEAGKPIAIETVRPVLSLKSAGEQEVDVRLTVGGHPASDLEIPDSHYSDGKQSDLMVVWDQSSSTFFLTPMNSVVLRLRNNARRLLGQVSTVVLNEILPALPWLSEHVDVDVDPELMRAASVTSLPPRLRARRHLDGVRFDIVCKAQGYRVPLRPGAEPAAIYTRTDSGVEVVTRSLESEQRAGRELVARLGLGRLREEPPWVFDATDYDEVGRVMEAIEAEAVPVEWVESEPLSVSIVSTENAALRVGSRRDWFELEGGVRVGDDTIDLAELLDAIREDRRTILVSADNLVVLDERIKQVFGLLAYKSPKGTPRLQPVHSTMLEELSEAGVEVDVPDTFLVQANALKESQSQPVEIPSALNAELRPYQEAGYRWLVRTAMWAPGACLADDMGLGKTLQALAFLLARSEQGAALVVTPTSLTHNWVLEAERFTPSLRVQRWTAQQGVEPSAFDEAGSVLVVSYDVLVNNAERFSPLRWSTVVLDEAHAIKNASTQRARAVRQLDAGFRLALTGTPLENRTSELWGLFDFVARGLLGNLSDFTAAWARPIEQHKDPRASEALSRLVRPFLLRRLKRDVAQELPAKVERNVFVDLTDAERAVYQQLRDASVKELTTRSRREENPGKNRILLLAALTRMRQAACHARMVSPEAPAVSSKQAVLMDLVEELVAEERRVLVFSQFPSVFAYLADGLTEQGVRFGQLDGSTPARQRARLVAAFEAGEFPVFLLSVKAGGTGLNLVAADTVIHFDPWWNPAVEDQATDRAHRIGQTQTVQVIRLVSSATVEEGILAMHADKRALTEAMLEGTDAAASLSLDELSGLLLSGA